MKHRKVTILVERTDGINDDENGIMFSAVNSLLVNEKTLSHHGFCLGVEGEDGFLTLTVLNVEQDAYNEFMADETPDDVLEGTGVPTFSTERSTQDAMSGECLPDTLEWFYGANIVLPVHDLELRMRTKAVK